MAWDFEHGNTQYFSAGDLTILDGLAELSIHQWSWLEEQTVRHHTLGKGDASDFVRFFYEPAGVNGKLRIPKLFVGIAGASVRAEGAADDDFPYQTWTAFGGGFKTNLAGGIQCWIDGVLKGSGNTNVSGFNGGQTLVNTATDLYIARRGSTSETWDGKIGETALWDVLLEAYEWAALAAGVSALLIRPESLIFYSPMRAEGATEWYWLPKQGTRADFTHANGPSAVADQYPLALPPLSHYSPHPVAGGVDTYGPFTKISTIMPPVSGYRDTAVQAGKAYKYKIRAFDTATPTPNVSSDSGEVTVTPALGLAGPGIVRSQKARKARLLRARHGRNRRLMDR